MHVQAEQNDSHKFKDRGQGLNVALEVEVKYNNYINRHSL